MPTIIAVWKIGMTLHYQNRSNSHTPLLIIYMNDTFNITTEAQLLAYVDNTSFLCDGRDADGVARFSNSVLALLESWNYINSLGINAKGTEAIFFTPRGKVIH